MKERNKLLRFIGLFVMLAGVVASGVWTLGSAEAKPMAQAGSGAMIADFEAGAPADWFVYNGGGSTVAPNFVDIGGNTVLSATYNVTDWGGFGALLPGQDWSDYHAVRFDFYGRNSGNTYVLEVQDGTGAVVERFHGLFVDDFDGWRQIVLPFSTFVRGGFQDGGAPDDGFQLTSIAAWVMPLPVATGEFMFDDLALVAFNPFADFEGGAPADWFQYAGGGSTVTPGFVTLADTDPYAIPGQIGMNGIMSGTYNVTDFGGFGAGLVPGQDWSGWEGVFVWFYGQNSGSTHLFELQEATPGNPVVERFQAAIVDDFDGWRPVALPFDTFFRGGFQDGGAPDDGLNLIDVRAWAWPLPGGSGPIVLDYLAVYGDQANITPKVSWDSAAYAVTEGSTISLTVSLNVALTSTVTVDYATVAGTASAADYMETSGTFTFNPGEMSKTLAIGTMDDADLEDDEMFTVELSGPIGAELGVRSTAEVTIVDNEEPPAPNPDKATLIDDFESGLPTGTDGNGVGIGFVTWSDGGSTVAITTTDAATAGIDPVPGSDPANQVLELESMIASWGGFTHAFENGAVDTWVSQDWSSYEGLSFWYHGTGTGTTVFVDVSENRNPGSTTDDAERWTTEWTDNTFGWQYVYIPFADLTRKDIGNGAPNDGWTGEEVHGWSLGTLATGGATESRYLDNASLVNRVWMIDDFESGLSTGTDGNGIGIGFVTWSDGGSTVAITTTDAAGAGIDPVPGSDPANQMLELESMIASWGGFTHAFENETVDTWVSQDWSGWEGLCFWYYGTGSGTTMFVDISENRNPGSTTDDAERWSAEWSDDVAGWQFVQIPFSDLNRKDIGNGAPNDGWTGAEVHGWSLGTLATGGVTELRYVDDFTIYGRTGTDQPLAAQFAMGNYEVVEGDVVTIEIALNMTATEDVIVTYRTVESNGSPDRDYIAKNGEVTIPAGASSGSFTLDTLENAKHEPDERVILNLMSAQGAELGFQRQTGLTIIDDDVRPPGLVDDFEGFHPFAYRNGNVSVTAMEIADSDGMARPDQDVYEHVAAVTFDGPADIAHIYSVPQDWSAYSYMGFWYYGLGQGDTVGVTLYDNQGMTTADTQPTEWTMVWSDEFDEAAGTPPNPNIWTHELGDGKINFIPGWGNSELQYYTDDPANAATDGNGNLVITTRATDPNNNDLVCWYGMCEYTSARLISQQKLNFAYGRIESRVLVPSGGDGIPDVGGVDFGDGLWPAFWMLGADIPEVGWPQSGEIDIMEFVSREPYEIFGTIHGPGYSGGNSYGDFYTFNEPVSANYHTYAIEWHPGEIRWYVDDILYHTAVPGDLNGNEWVYDHDFFLLLNMAVGGNFGGPVGDNTGFPQEMVVDYVRVYQLENNSERFSYSFTDDMAGWRWVSVPMTDFVRSAEQPAGAPDDGLNLTEVWGYELSFNGTGTTYVDYVMMSNSVPTSVGMTTVAGNGGSMVAIFVLLTLLLVAIGGVIVWRRGGVAHS
ncbi:MAG TPA: carbohydrate binding domain-containing protein [Anaerolineae bacterium]|nr:carbohydrate binding domain-containing protein [Anaerolineae bacterium]